MNRPHPSSTRKPPLSRLPTKISAPRAGEGYTYLAQPPEAIGVVGSWSRQRCKEAQPSQRDEQVPAVVTNPRHDFG